MSVFAKAFEDAGFVPADVRLRLAAIEALKTSPGSWDGAKDALYAAVRSDTALLWEMFAPYRSQAAHMVLAKAAAEMRESERAQRAERVVPGPSAPGHDECDSQMLDARRAETQNSSGRGKRNSGNQAAAAPSARAGMDAVAAVTRLSLLDTFRINGRAIGDCTPEEAQRWATSRERDARFVRLLTANLPPGAPIRTYRRPEDTQAIYEQASQEVRDAQ
jgi:hypothetical protein